MSIRKTSVAIDEDLAREAQRALGAATLRETIERAFLEVLRARARADDLRALREMRGLDLEDADLMRRAWAPSR